METRIKANFKRGFEACRICPHNPQKILKKLNKQPANKDEMENCLARFLSEKVYGDKKVVKRRPRRADIVPGKPVLLSNGDDATTTDGD